MNISKTLLSHILFYSNVTFPAPVSTFLLGWCWQCCRHRPLQWPGPPPWPPSPGAPGPGGRSTRRPTLSHRQSLPTSDDHQQTWECHEIIKYVSLLDIPLIWWWLQWHYQIFIEIFCTWRKQLSPLYPILLEISHDQAARGISPAACQPPWGPRGWWPG